MQAVAIVDLPDSNGETSVEELNKEFGADHAIFLVGDVTNAEELTGVVLIHYCKSVIKKIIFY